MEGLEVALEEINKWMTRYDELFPCGVGAWVVF